jgi:phosphoserine phosphatase
MSRRLFALPDWRSVSRVPRSSRWRLACFDLDGTLVRGTTVSQHLADRFGQSEQMAELERRYATGEISN